MDQDLFDRLDRIADALEKMINSGGVGSPQSSPRGEQFDINFFTGKLRDASIKTQGLADDQKKLIEQNIKLITSAKNAQAAFNSLTPAMQKYILEEQKARRTAEDTRRAYDDNKKAVEKSTETTRKYDAALNNVERTLSSFGSALLSQEVTLRKYGSTVQSALDGFSKGLDSIKDSMKNPSHGFFSAMQGTIKALGIISKEALDYGDRVLKNKDQLAQMGVVGQYSSERLLEMAKNAEFTSATLEGFTKAAKSLGTTVMALGNNGNEAIEQFSKVSTITMKELKNLQALGFSPEEVAQTKADYLNLTAKQGYIINEEMRRGNKLHEGSKEYLKTLIDLTAVTGMNRDEAKKARELAASQYQLQVKLMEMDREKAKIEQLRKSGRITGEEADRRIGKISDRQKGITEFVEGAGIAGGPEMAAMAAQFIIGKGALQSPEMARMFGGREMREAYRSIQEGSYQRGRAEDALAQQQERNLAQFGSFTIGMNAEFAKQMGATNLQMLATTRARMGGASFEERYRQQGGKTAAAVEGQGDQKQADSAERIRGAIMESQQKLQNEMDRVSKAALEKLAPMAEGIASMVTLLTNVTGLLSNSNLLLAAIAAATGIGAATGLVKGVLLRRAAGAAASAIGTAGAGAAGAGAAGAGAAGAGAAGAGAAGAGAASSLANLSRASTILGRLGIVGALGSGAYTTYKGLQTAETGEEKGAAIGKGTGQAAGAIGAGMAGAKVGAMLGAAGGPLGILLGGALGAMIGGVFGGKVGETIGEKVGGAAGKALVEKQEEKKDDEVKETDKIERINFALRNSILELKKSIDQLTDTIQPGASSAPTTRSIAPKGSPMIAPSKPFEGNRKEFADKMYNTLLEQAKKAGVANPEVIAQLGTAQSALETGWGKSLAGGNNYFGIKDFSKGGGKNLQQTKEFINGREVFINAAFRRYGSMEESAGDYIQFLMKNPRYAKVLQSGNKEEAARLIREAGYATDPRYSEKLLTIMGGIGTPTLASASGQPAPSVPNAAARLSREQATAVQETARAQAAAQQPGVATAMARDASSEVLVAVFKQLSSIDQRMAALNSTQERALRVLQG